MPDINKDKTIFLLIGLIIGLLAGTVFTSIGGIAVYEILKGKREGDNRYEAKKTVVQKSSAKNAGSFKDFCFSFEKKDDMDVLKAAENTSIEISKSNATHGSNSLLVKIGSGSGYPGISWEAYDKHVQNWSNAKDFHFDVYNNTEDYIGLTVKFKSGKKYPKKSYSTVVTLKPLAMNNIKINLKDIASSCNLQEMSYVKLFTVSPQKDITLFLDNMGTKYEKSAAAATVGTEEAMVALEKESSSSKALKSGFDIFVASGLDKIFKDGKTLTKPSFSDTAMVSMARNEYESFQVVVNNGKERLKSVQIGLSDLINKQTGDRIDRQNITWRVVEYVPTQKPYYAVKFVGLWPDPLMPGNPVDIEPGETQPFWITIYAPEGAPAGTYTGAIGVKGEGFKPVYISVAAKIFDFTIPTASSLRTAFDLYPHITAHRYPLKEKEEKGAYNARIARLNEQYIIDMVKHRIDPVLNIDPLSQDDLRKVDTYRAYGLTNFSIGKRGGTFNNNWPKTDEEIEKLLPLYRTYGENLKINKMLDYHYIYTWDEGKVGNPQVAKVSSMIHRAHPELKNMVCYHGFWDPEEDPEWGKDIDIWCFGIGDFDEKKMRQLQYRGMEIWTYISGPGSSGYPNLAIDFDSIDYRVIPWLCWKYDIKGFLYWCVNWWPYVDPFESASNTKWNQNGNGLLYYPGENGPIASLRLEIFRDGMEDYEYLHLLNRKINSAKQEGLDAGNNKILARAKDLLNVTDIARSMNNFMKDSEKFLSKREGIANAIEAIDRMLVKVASSKANTVQVVEYFTEPITVTNGNTFGNHDQLTFESYRGGSLIPDEESGSLVQLSNSYRDTAIIRSTKPLPPTYKISAVVGDIDYDLDKISGVGKDPEYQEGPANENGCYLLAITDVLPDGHHTNDWWHKHRKVCIDVDNNIWGHGMPNPIFMVYFDNNNDLASFNGETNQWVFKWTNAVTYNPRSWYRVEIEKTRKQFIMRIYDEEENLLKEGSVNLAEVWNEDGRHPDYLAIGDPHENYYQGSMKIKSITMPVEVD